jgi:hypothetical protein
MKLKKGIEKKTSLGKTLHFEGVANWISGGKCQIKI